MKNVDGSICRRWVSKRFFFMLVLLFICSCTIIFKKYNFEPKIYGLPYLLNETHHCLNNSFHIFSRQRYQIEWLEFYKKVEDCSFEFLKSINVEKLKNVDETKFALLPLKFESECNAVTLGIGRDVRSEKALRSKMPHCKFFGVDPDEAESGKLYKEQINGKFVQGLVGAKNDTYQASVLSLDGKVYKSQVLPHFSLHELLLKHYNATTVIDYLFMDIEGDEFGLLEDMIRHPKKYPVICQLNVEYHNPYENNRGERYFDALYKSIEKGLYIPLKAYPLPQFLFNRAFFVNLNKICIEKFLYVEA